MNSPNGEITPTVALAAFRKIAASRCGVTIDRSILTGSDLWSILSS